MRTAGRRSPRTLSPSVASYCSSRYALCSSRAAGGGEDDVETAGKLSLSLMHLRYSQEKCPNTFVNTEVLHVPDQVFCFLKHYDEAYEKAVKTSTCDWCRRVK